MHVHKIEWITKGYDLHLIPGAKIQPSLLKIYESESTWKWASDINESTDNVSVKFDWRISIRGDGVHGIAAWSMQLDLDQGWLIVSDTLNPPPHRLYNSIVEVTVIDKNQPQREPLRSAIRIHLHDSIKGAWITPSTLTVHEGADKIRFSILAWFNNTVSGKNYPVNGDISRYPGIEFISDDPNFVSIDQINKTDLIVHGRTSSVTIRAKLPPPFDVVNPRAATVFIENSWSLLPAKVEPVGERSISQSRINNCPNILFIPDGFKDGEKPLFKKLVTGIFNQIKTSPSLIPYPYFAINKTINFWSTFIPSPEWGTSILHLMNVKKRFDNQRYGRIDNEPYAIKPDISNPGMWTLQELIYVVGLPLPFDKKQPDDLQTYNTQLENWIERFNHKDIILSNPGEQPIDTWKRKVGPDPPSGNFDLWKVWKSISGYVLADERDTALGMSKGDRPFVMNQHGRPDTHAIALFMHPFRTNRKHLDKFLVNLKAPRIGDPIGKIWGPTDPNDRLKGKDRSLVVVLCRGSPDAGVQDPSTDLIGLSIDPDTSEVTLKVKDEAFFECEIVPNKLPPDLKRPPFDIVATVCHELSHAFGLLDEYGEKDSMPDTDIQAKGLHLVGNIQHRRDLLFQGGITSAGIKWRWLRIEKIGILVQNPTQPNQAQKLFDILLKPGQAEQFAKHDLVFLRQRPLLKDPPCKMSIPLIVHEEPIGDIVKVRLSDPSGTLDTNDFPAGTGNSSHDSILFTPKHRIDIILELVHKKIFDHINNSRRPLSAPSGNPTWNCLTHLRTQVNRPSGTEVQPPNLPQNFLNKPIAQQDLIIGLYEGGGTYHCNVYHPAGSCQMRRRSDVSTSYCHVCRYFLADLIDPSLHDFIDMEYETDYSKI